MDIHNQTGTIERPLATLGDVLPDFSRQDLQKTTKAITARAGLKKRAQWWIDAHPVKTVFGAAAIGVLATMSLAAYFHQRLK